MALGTPSLATPTVHNASNSVVTASFTPTASALLVVMVGARASSVLNGEPSISNTGGLSFTPLASGVYDAGSGTRQRGRAWAAVAPASPSSMTVTGSSTSSGRMSIAVVQITGHAGIPGNAIAADSVSGDPSMTLGSAPAASSLVLAFLTAAGTAALSAPAGFIELDDTSDGAGIVLHCCHDITSAPTTTTYSSTNNQSVGIAIEVAEASGAGRVMRAKSRSFRHMVIR